MSLKTGSRKYSFPISAVLAGAFFLIAIATGGCRGKAPEGKPGAAGQAVEAGAGSETAPAASGAEAPSAAESANPSEGTNNPPEITSISIGYDPVEQGGGIRAKVEARDPEGAELALKYRWIRNLQETIESAENPLPRKFFSRGDILQVEVIASDGELSSPPRVSTQFGVQNSAPLITSNPTNTFPKGLYTYEVKANDPDEDKLTYALKNAPSGMQIDSSTGVIKWTPSEGGKFDVEVGVTDIMGAEATQNFTLDVTEVEKK